ncbi:MAG: tetratricopeptide repeat protein, partial [Planctomycetia bacterium]
EQRSPEAVAQLEAWSRREPANPNPQIELARIYQEHGDIRQAENHLVDALAIDPSNPRVLVALGQVREILGDNGQALANYSRALSIDGQQPVVAAKVASLGGTTQAGVVQAGGARTASLPMPAVPLEPVALVQPAAQPLPPATGNAAR